MSQKPAFDYFDPEEAMSDVPTENINVSIRELIQLLRIDGEVFLTFFLPDQLDLAIPEFHLEIWNLLTDLEKERALLAIPRDHAKTTLAKLVVIWYWLYTPHRFAVYLSNTNAIARGACKDIIAFLKIPNFISTFGQVKWIKESDTESLWIFEIQLVPGRWKRCILRGIGQGQQMRGINLDNSRPDIAVVDDVEDNDNTESEHQQKKLDKWMFGPFLKALARQKKILWLGNMLSKTSLLARLSKNPRWNPVVFGCLYKDRVTGHLKPLWPDKWTIESLKEDFAEYKSNQLVETWMCEMMNMPGHGDNGFDLSHINYMPSPTPDEILCSWITIDPAFGQKQANDESSIAVHCITKTSMIPITVAVVHGRLTDTEIFDEALSLAQYWNAWTWGIESVAAQKVLITLFKLLLVMRGLMPNAVEMVELLSGGAAKSNRIKSWVSLMQKKEWAIHDGDLDITTQLTNYQFNVDKQPDDIIDSCAYGPQMMDVYFNIIMAKASETPLDESSAQHGVEVSGNV